LLLNLDLEDLALDLSLGAVSTGSARPDPLTVRAFVSAGLLAP